MWQTARVVMIRRIPQIACVLLVGLGLWVTGVALSSPPPELPPGAAHAVSAPGNPANARALLGFALVAGGGLGAWIFSRR